MADYYIELQNVVNTALKELEEEHRKGKLANTPVSNTHFLVRWVTRSLKTQRFPRCVGDDLTRWQKAGRSKGTASDLLFTFKNISAFYQSFFPIEKEPVAITDADIETFLDRMEQDGWSVCTEYDLTEKTQIFSEGDNSLVLCANQCVSCFLADEQGQESSQPEMLIKPISMFVRGNHARFVQLATDAGFLVHKRTDYKSIVKYHGEYLIYPFNKGTQLAEIPIGFVK
ncbi:alpha-acetolactate decarboxylase [Vibrio albus]|jgi:hypothetical protein|uniref:Alpha-acetolactate decarboxylase n=1 Tax=Vibrio albus TaxID=2200953 RepID=A0A2U3BB26_9VIBR|nr:DUF2913 family protein [Vibrio albus]PWI33991.1 alpha-acetolactate decarboxylase [Vibrio albus]